MCAQLSYAIISLHNTRAIHSPVSTQDREVLAEFAFDDAVLLVGSETGEVAAGRQALAPFFERIFARDVTFSWDWDRIDVFRAGDVVWFFALGHTVRAIVERMEAQTRE